MFLLDTEFDLGIIGYSVIRPDMSLLLRVENQRDISLSRFQIDQESEAVRQVRELLNSLAD